MSDLSGPKPTAHVTVTVRYFAAARAAAGVEQETVSADAGATVGSVLAAITAAHDAELARVLVRCSYLLDAVAVHGPETPVRDESVLDVLPPFAGG